LQADPDSAYPLLDRNYVAPAIATTWRERYLFKSGSGVYASDDLFPFPGRDPKRFIWSLLSNAMMSNQERLTGAIN
jgi:hypothetical protein